jgi:hypothetical protein
VRASNIVIRSHVASCLSPNFSPTLRKTMWWSMRRLIDMGWPLTFVTSTSIRVIAPSTGGLGMFPVTSWRTS